MTYNCLPKLFLLTVILSIAGQLHSNEVSAKGFPVKYSSPKNVISIGKNTKNTVITKTFVDSKNNLYVTGRSPDTSGITTAGAHQPKNTKAGSAFIEKYDSNGVKLWGTFNGNINTVNEIFTDTSGRVIISQGGSSYAYSMIICFDSKGTYLWCDTIVYPYTLNNISVNPGGAVYAAGIIGVYPNLKIFIFKLDTTGKITDSIVTPFVNYLPKYGYGLDSTYFISSGLDKFGNYYAIGESFDTSSLDAYFEAITRYTLSGGVSTMDLGMYYIFPDFAASFSFDDNGNIFIAGRTSQASHDGELLWGKAATYQNQNWNSYTIKIDSSFNCSWQSIPLTYSEYDANHLTLDRFGNYYLFTDTVLAVNDQKLLLAFDRNMTQRKTFPLFPDFDRYGNSLVTFDKRNSMIYSSLNKVWKLSSDCNMRLAIKGNNAVKAMDTNSYSVITDTNLVYSWIVKGGTIIFANKNNDSIRVAWGKGTKGNIHLSANCRYGCADSIDYPIFIDTIPVWPGDANRDRVVDVKDLLNIGAGYSKSGPARPTASINWLEQPCMDWKDTFSSYVNFKHADCNGDSIINSSDTLAISANYSKVHPKNTIINQGKPTDPPLYFVFNKDSAKAGDLVQADIMYGSSTIPAKNIYGLAFSVLYDASLIESVSSDLSSCWLSAKPLSMVVVPYSGQIDMAMVRTDQKDSSGYGKIGSLLFKIASTIPSGFNPFVLSFSNNEQVNSILQYQAIYLKTDSFTVGKLVSGIQSAKSNFDIKISPNPASSVLNLQVNSMENETFSYFISDAEGRIINNGNIHIMPGENNHFINLQGINPGIYLLSIQNKQGVQKLKFVKE